MRRCEHVAGTVGAELLQQLLYAITLAIATHVSLGQRLPHQPSTALARNEPLQVTAEARTLRRMAATELADNRERLTRSLKVVEAKLQTQRRVGPIPVSAHVHHGVGTAQCVPDQPLHTCQTWSSRLCRRDSERNWRLSDIKPTDYEPIPCMGSYMRSCSTASHNPLNTLNPAVSRCPSTSDEEDTDESDSSDDFGARGSNKRAKRQRGRGNGRGGNGVFQSPMPRPEGALPQKASFRAGHACPG